MTRVSGTSGAAPVWREVMLALHRHRPGVQPAMPAGIERRAVRFSDGVEPDRAEFFLGRTGQSDLVEAPATARRPRIVNPVSGAVYALDPDIPVDRQRIRLAATGAVSGEHLRLDAQDLGPADASPMVLPGPGAHRLQLVDPAGKVIDRALFTVR
jgi:penicillin-binding protein 1C